MTFRLCSWIPKALLGVILLALLPASARAITFADAIKNGGTINLSSSQTYTGSAFIGKSTTINGNGAKVQLTGSQLVSIGNGSSVTFNNLTITGGKGVYVNSSNNRFVGNNVTFSYSVSDGLLADSASVSLYNCRFENIRKSAGVAYCLSIQRCPNLVVKGCTFINSDMGAYLYASTGASFENCVFQNCNESDGVLIHSGSSAYFFACTITGCESGLAVTDGSAVAVSKCTLRSNIKDGSSNYKGQGIYAMRGSVLSVAYTTIENNDNEGIYCSDSRTFIQDCYIAGNGWKAQDGNGINLDNTWGRIQDCRVSKNYMFGIQATGQDVLIRGCEIRNNRLGGIHISANSAGHKQEVYGNICDNNTYEGSSEYELNCNNSYTRIKANNNIFSSNPGIGVFFQSGSYGDLTGNLLYSNGGNNMNIYKANVSLRKSVVANSKKGMFLNAAPSSSIHENDILNCEVGADIMPDTGTTTDFTQNWWGSPSGPYSSQHNTSGEGTKVGWNIDMCKPWKTSRVTYYAVFRYFSFTSGVTKVLSNSQNMPFAKFYINSPTNDQSQLLAAQAANTNLFPHIPINFTLPSKVLYIWVNANRGIRTKSSWSQLELNTSGGVLSSLAALKVYKYNFGTSRWDALAPVYSSATGTLKVNTKDIQGYYLVF